MNATTTGASLSATTVLPEPAQLAVPYAGPSTGGGGGGRIPESSEWSAPAGYTPQAVDVLGGIVNHGPYIPAGYRTGVSVAGQPDTSEVASVPVADETSSAVADSNTAAIQEAGDLPWIDVFLDRDAGEASATSGEPYAGPEYGVANGSDEANARESAIGMEILPTLHVEDEVPRYVQSGLAFYSKAVEPMFDEAAIKDATFENTDELETEEEVRGGAFDTLVSERAALILEGMAARIRRREIAVGELSLSSSESAVIATVLSALLRAG